MYMFFLVKFLRLKKHLHQISSCRVTRQLIENVNIQPKKNFIGWRNFHLAEAITMMYHIKMLLITYNLNDHTLIFNLQLYLSVTHVLIRGLIFGMKEEIFFFFTIEEV